MQRRMRAVGNSGLEQIHGENDAQSRRGGQQTRPER